VEMTGNYKKVETLYHKINGIPSIYISDFEWEVVKYIFLWS